MHVQPFATSPSPGSPLRRVPLVTLYLTDRCNSRCVTCDYWRHGRVDLDLDRVEQMLPELMALGTEVVLLSGGEPLLNRHWQQIAQLLRDNAMKPWLLTSGLSLEKQARAASRLCDSITVSLDGTNRATYAAIRGLDAFENVRAGIAAAADLGSPVSVRVTLQRANYRELPAFVELASGIGAREVSFLAVDVANPHAFARLDDFRRDLALRPEDLPVLEGLISNLERDRADDFSSGFIAESPRKLRRILQYFAALCGRGPFPPVRCNAPEFSAVIDARGRVHPCFFIPGATGEAIARPGRLTATLNDPGAQRLRASIRAGGRPECLTCVCPMWRDSASASCGNLSLRTRGAA